MLRPFLPEVISLNVIGNNKVKLINATSYNYGCNCGNMAHITQGESTKPSTVKSELHISRASEEVTSPHQCLRRLSCSEHEQSSVRGYVKTRCQLCNASTQLNSKPYQTLLPAPSTCSRIRDALGFQ